MTPWRTGTATGVGSLPGTDPLEAAKLVLGELAIPHLPELPNRGHLTDLAGRGAALLADLYVDVQPTGWRFVPRSSREGRRAKDLLRQDVDAFELAAHGEHPEHVKVQATGPWTLATLIELHRGDKALADHQAVADIAQSLAEGLRQHVADLQRRLPGTTIHLQLDEPSLNGVLHAGIPTASGFATLRAPDPQTVRAHLRTALAAHDSTVLHCCARRPPIALLAEAGAISVDAAMLDPRDDDALGEVVESGTGLLLGVPTDVKAALQVVGRMRDRVGVRDLTLTPPCGLAGSRDPRRELQQLTKAAEEL
jgi:methionine synthase II (cobalamin-independent)